jgi:hypothetical protein
MIKFVQGETAVIDIAVIERTGAPSNLTGATGICAYETAEAIIKKACTIAGNVVTVTFSAADTEALLGDYPFEVKIQDALSSVDTVIKDKFTVIESLMPVYTLD